MQRHHGELHHNGWMGKEPKWSYLFTARIVLPGVTVQKLIQGQSLDDLVGFGGMISVPTGGTVYKGRFIHSLGLGALEIVEGFCVVSKHGVIESIGTSPSFPESYRMVEMSPDEFMIPGFIDTHTHAPQHVNIGVGLQFELLEWLDKVTFPAEASLTRAADESDSEYSARISSVYAPMVKEYLRNGTTTCCYFGSIQVPANIILAKEVLSAGQRAFIGKVCMDCNSPDFYCEESAEQSINDTAEFCRCVKSLDNGRNLVNPIITPRFAITCSRNLMSGLGNLAKDLDLNVQTHISENRGEIAFTKELFPEAESYAQVYDQAGLLTPRTVLAHAIHLEEEEQDLVKERGCGISHCPNSNFSLSSGIMPLRKYLEKGLKIGLGTDVSGGYSPSILDAMRQAIIASKALAFQDPSYSAITVQEAFHLATLGGAEALAISDRVGNFAPGKHFDALLIKPRQSTTGNLSADLERFIFCGDDRDIKQTIVDGVVVSTCQ